MKDKSEKKPVYIKRITPSYLKYLEELDVSSSQTIFFTQKSDEKINGAMRSASSLGKSLFLKKITEITDTHTQTEDPACYMQIEVEAGFQYSSLLGPQHSTKTTGYILNRVGAEEYYVRSDEISNFIEWSEFYYLDADEEETISIKATGTGIPCIYSSKEGVHKPLVGLGLIAEASRFLRELDLHDDNFGVVETKEAFLLKKIDHDLSSHTAGQGAFTPEELLDPASNKKAEKWFSNDSQVTDLPRWLFQLQGVKQEINHIRFKIITAGFSSFDPTQNSIIDEVYSEVREKIAYGRAKDLISYTAAAAEIPEFVAFLNQTITKQFICSNPCPIIINYEQYLQVVKQIATSAIPLQLFKVDEEQYVLKIPALKNSSLNLFTFNKTSSTAEAPSYYIDKESTLFLLGKLDHLESFIRGFTKAETNTLYAHLIDNILQLIQNHNPSFDHPLHSNLLTLAWLNPAFWKMALPQVNEKAFDFFYDPLNVKLANALVKFVPNFNLDDCYQKDEETYCIHLEIGEKELEAVKTFLEEKVTTDLHVKRHRYMTHSFKFIYDLTFPLTEEVKQRIERLGLSSDNQAPAPTRHPAP